MFFFATSKITEFKIIHKKKILLNETASFVVVHPYIPIHRYNLFHFFDIFIKIFFDAITDHHCFFFFSLFFLSHGNHRLLSYKSSHTMLTYTFIYLQFFCLFLWSLFHLWTGWWCSVHLQRFWYIYNLLLHWQYSYQRKYYNHKDLVFIVCHNI